MDLHLRLEQPADHRTVEELTREAFWGFSQPTCEHLIAHKLRQAPAFVPELDYIARDATLTSLRALPRDKMQRMINT